jgi:hypothetical protein
MNIQIIAYTKSICNAKSKKHLFAQRPQIASVPGASRKERQRYRVLFGKQILGDRLSLGEALKMAQGGGK